MALTYSSYLRIDELLALQEPRSSPPEHDEMLFIIIHQAYELWFKQLLLELDKISGDFSANRLHASISTWKRCRFIMKLLVEQLDVLETMTPLSFAAFRDRLETASGFQSSQFRELEFLLGFKRPEMMKFHSEGSLARVRLEERFRGRTLMDHFYDLLEHQGAAVPAELKARDVTRPVEPNEALQLEILRLYKEKFDMLVLFEIMTDFDEGLQEWRYRHVKLVERTIGNKKKGTGGSLGVDFLKRSLFIPTFPDLWAIRHMM
ncbi:MAG: Tryptophan 2,3-dioxygenase [Myxococcota bacterium]|nr:Tryptophan 2,3-dioxygenase [Myxococcota bacterium]